MLRKIDSNTLFLSGVVLISFGVLLFHINPYQIADQDFWLEMQTFIWTLTWRPAGTLQIVIGSILIIKSLKR